MRDQLRSSAFKSFEKLADSARHFAAPLSRVMGRERGPFIAFLAGLHAPDVQQRLLVDADPFSVGEKLPDLKDHEVKRQSMQAMEECLGTLPADIRNRIYHDIRALHHLMGLASFPFERVLSEFSPVAVGEEVPIPLSRIADELGKLAGILGTSVDELVNFTASPKRRGGPQGRALRTFEEVSKQTRAQQKNILDGVDALIKA